MDPLHQTVNVLATPFGKHGALYCAAVADEKLVRLANLKEGLKKIPVRDRARHLLQNVPGDDGEPSTIGFWSGLLGGKRNFGEKLARRIEDGLRWPRGSLDTEKLMATEEMELLLHFRSIAAGSPLREQALVLLKTLAAAGKPQNAPPEAISELQSVKALRHGTQEPHEPSTAEPSAKRATRPRARTR